MTTRLRRHPQRPAAASTKTSLVFRPVRYLELDLADMMTAAGVVFERHEPSAALFSRPSTTSPLMNDPCTTAQVMAKASEQTSRRRDVGLERQGTEA
jgi:hypothetical protein